MDAIHIPQLAQAPDRTEVIQVNECLDNLKTLTPVRGKLQVKHEGNYVEVSAQAETIITLTCDRCLQHYNYRLAINTSELIWLDVAADQPYTGPLEREIPLEELVETLPPQGYLHPGKWLYEQLSLEIPPQRLCDNQCPGIPAADNSATEPQIDCRWASLEVLKKELS